MPRGRPSLGERIPVSIRVTPERKKRLDEAAAASGRSLSQECEFHLERSFLLGELIAAGLMSADVTSKLSEAAASKITSKAAH